MPVGCLDLIDPELQDAAVVEDPGRDEPLSKAVGRESRVVGPAHL
jgi:hypothetical protein